jgi:diguanylate cyclase (GGDEF)-like protein
VICFGHLRWVVALTLWLSPLLTAELGQAQNPAGWRFWDRDATMERFGSYRLGARNNQAATWTRSLKRWNGDVWDTFTVSEATESDRLLFSWRIDGGPWTPFSPARTAVFHRLPAGSRQFEVRAMDRNGNIDPGSATYAITVPVPWFQNVTFQVVAGLLLASILILFTLATLSYRHRGRLILELHRKNRMEIDRQVILEMIARRKPLPVIFHRIARSVAVNCPGTQCGVLRVSRHGVEAPGDPSLPESFIKDLKSIYPGASSFDELWNEIHSIAAQNRLGGCHFAPIRSGVDELLGAIAVFSRSREPHPFDLALVSSMSGLAGAAIDNERLYEKLAHQASHDTLTGLPNRLSFESALQEALAQANHSRSTLAVLFLDLDRFKQINDTLGHRFGDMFLKHVANRLMGAVPAGEVLARVGGDEFTVLLRHEVDPGRVERIAGSMLRALRSPFVVEGREFFASASIGISLFPQDGRDPATLQKHADSAMYRAKAGGKNCYQFFSDEMVISTSRALAMERVLRKALDEDGFELYYQPQLNINGELAGLEALLRLHHPELGVTSPDLFIGTAEETGLIIPIGQWVLHQVCAQIRRWRQRGYVVPKIAVNVSALQFIRTTFSGVVANALQEMDVRPDLIELELTESTIMSDLSESADQMRKLRALGVRIAVDDFGTGYSSLNYLHKLPIDVLKIDRSFIDGIDGPNSTLPLVQAILALARNLELEVVAEGVETPQQYSILRGIGCTLVQGYLFARPQPVQSVEELLRFRELHDLEAALGSPSPVEPIVQ